MKPVSYTHLESHTQQNINNEIQNTVLVKNAEECCPVRMLGSVQIQEAANHIGQTAQGRSEDCLLYTSRCV